MPGGGSLAAGRVRRLGGIAASLGGIAASLGGIAASLGGIAALLAGSVGGTRAGGLCGSVGGGLWIWVWTAAGCSEPGHGGAPGQQQVGDSPGAAAAEDGDKQQRAGHRTHRTGQGPPRHVLRSAPGIRVHQPRFRQAYEGSRSGEEGNQRDQQASERASRSRG